METTNLNGDLIKNFKDYKTIETYEDACAALNIDPIVFYSSYLMTEVSEGCKNYGCKFVELPKRIIALIKLETINRALWGVESAIKSNDEGCIWHYSPSFEIFTKKEKEKLGTELPSSCLQVGDNGDVFCYVGNKIRITRREEFGFHLNLPTPEKARYFGKQFIDIWRDYLIFDLQKFKDSILQFERLDYKKES